MKTFPLKPAHSGNGSGFTLIELSIVLVIIGLVIGGILVGQELIYGAQVRRMVSEKEQLTSAVNTFRLKYNALPGDMTDATALWGTNANCNAVSTTLTTTTCNGNGDGKVGGLLDVVGNTNTIEPWLFWQHLSNAQLWSGLYTGARISGGLFQRFATIGLNVPASAAYPDKALFVEYYAKTDNNSWMWAATKGGRHQLHIGAPIAGTPGASFVGTPWLTNRQAYAIDSKYDDGMPGSGFIINNEITPAPGGGNLDCWTGTLDPALATYKLSSTEIACNIIFTNVL